MKSVKPNFSRQPLKKYDTVHLKPSLSLFWATFKLHLPCKNHDKFIENVEQREKSLDIGRTQAGRWGGAIEHINNNIWTGAAILMLHLSPAPKIAPPDENVSSA